MPSLKAKLPVVAQKRSRSARAGDDVVMRQVAIRYIGELNDSASLDELIRIYDADKTKEIRFQIIRALAERDDARACKAFLRSHDKATHRNCVSRQSGGSAIMAAWQSTISCSSTRAKQTYRLSRDSCARSQTTMTLARAASFSKSHVKRPD